MCTLGLSVIGTTPLIQNSAGLVTALHPGDGGKANMSFCLNDCCETSLLNPCVCFRSLKHFLTSDSTGAIYNISRHDTMSSPFGRLSIGRRKIHPQTPTWTQQCQIHLPLRCARVGFSLRLEPNNDLSVSDQAFCRPSPCTVHCSPPAGHLLRHRHADKMLLGKPGLQETFHTKSSMLAGARRSKPRAS